MSKRDDYIDRYFYWRRKGYDHKDAKRMAIGEMIGFGLIKSELEIYNENMA